MYTAIAIDDELSALNLIKEYMSKHSNFRLLRTFNDPILALNEISNLKEPVDVIFLDVEMPGINGLELANLVRNKAKKLIFTTAHTQYALDFYELDADVFLFKPYPQGKFSKILQKFFPESIKTDGLDQSRINFISIKRIKQRNVNIKIDISTLLAIEAQQKYLKLYLSGEIVTVRSSLRDMLKLLSHYNNFNQIHRSFIISENHIKSIERTHVVLENNLKIPIGRLYRDFYLKNYKKHKYGG